MKTAINLVKAPIAGIAKMYASIRTFPTQKILNLSDHTKTRLTLQFKIPEHLKKKLISQIISL